MPHEKEAFPTYVDWKSAESAPPTQAPLDIVTVHVEFMLAAELCPAKNDSRIMISLVSAAIGGNPLITDAHLSCAESESGRKLLLNGVIWLFSFDLSIPLSAMTSDFSASIVTELSSSSFLAAVKSQLGAILDTGSILVTQLVVSTPSPVPTIGQIYAINAPGTRGKAGVATLTTASMGAIAGGFGGFVCLVMIALRIVRARTKGPGKRLDEDPEDGGPSSRSSEASRLDSARHTVVSSVMAPLFARLGTVARKAPHTLGDADSKASIELEVANTIASHLVMESPRTSAELLSLVENRRSQALLEFADANAQIVFSHTTPSIFVDVGERSKMCQRQYPSASDRRFISNTFIGTSLDQVGTSLDSIETKVAANAIDINTFCDVPIPSDAGEISLCSAEHAAASASETRNDIISNEPSALSISSAAPMGYYAQAMNDIFIGSTLDQKKTSFDVLTASVDLAIFSPQSAARNAVAAATAVVSNKPCELPMSNDTSENLVCGFKDTSVTSETQPISGTEVYCLEELFSSATSTMTAIMMPPTSQFTPTFSMSSLHSKFQPSLSRKNPEQTPRTEEL
jgi:hypothetical protein